MRHTLVRLLASGALAASTLLAAQAHAAVTYNLTLTANTGSTYSGTGSITLAYAPNATGLTTYANSDVSGLNFLIGGQTFTSPPGTFGSVQFQDGQVRNISFSEQIGTTPNRYSLQTTSVYAFYYNNLQSVSNGTLTSSIASTPMTSVPEPASWSMLILGMGAVGYALRRRQSVRVSYAA